MDPYRIEQNNMNPNQFAGMAPAIDGIQSQIDPTTFANNKPKRNNFLSCIWGLIPFTALIIFIFFGGKIFSFFHIENIYNFIISIFIIIILYIIALFIIGITIRPPRDLLGVALERYLKEK